jgi:hypothetical protein
MEAMTPEQRIQELAFNAITKQANALRCFLTLETREVIATAVIAAITPETGKPERAELEEVNLILREQGFAYPPGARGVHAMAGQYEHILEELRRLDPKTWPTPDQPAPPPYRPNKALIGYIEQGQRPSAEKGQ